MNATARISFNCEDIEFDFPEKEKTCAWITQTINYHGFTLGFLDYIFCSDEYLLTVNKTYLNHDTYTDIITFNYNETEENIASGDILISIDRVKENAANFATDFEEELQRVIIHGVLHLLGLNDKTEEQQLQMTTEENRCLAIYYKK